jgi:hypothetical protein
MRFSIPKQRNHSIVKIQILLKMIKLHYSSLLHSIYYLEWTFVKIILFFLYRFLYFLKLQCSILLVWCPLSYCNCACLFYKHLHCMSLKTVFRKLIKIDRRFDHLHLEQAEPKDVFWCADNVYWKPFLDIINIKRDTAKCKAECKVYIFISWPKKVYFDALIMNLKTVPRYLHY